MDYIFRQKAILDDILSDDYVYVDDLPNFGFLLNSLGLGVTRQESNQKYYIYHFFLFDMSWAKIEGFPLNIIIYECFEISFLWLHFAIQKIFSIIIVISNPIHIMNERPLFFVFPFLRELSTCHKLLFLNIIAFLSVV